MPTRPALIASLFLLCGNACAGYGFEQPQTILSGVTVTALTIGDISGDGRDDVVLLPRPTEPTAYSEILVALQLPNGQLATPLSVRFGVQDMLIGSVVLADMDGDGDLDVLVGGTSGMYVLRNDGSGTLVESGRVTNVSVGPFDVDDVDGDGMPDVVNAGSGSLEMFSVFTGDGLGGLGAPIPLGFPAAREFQLVDIDGDGRRDLGYSVGDEIRLYHHDAAGYAQTPTIIRAGLASRGADTAFADINGDGRIDFAIAKQGTTGADSLIAIYQQQRDGRFRRQPGLPTAYAPGAMRFHDIDGDGRDDLVVPHSGQFDIGVYLAGSTGLKTESSFAGIATRLRSGYAIGDIDGDGLQDILTASPIGGLSFLKGREDAAEADLVTLATLSPSTATVQLRNAGTQGATGAIYLYADINLRSAAVTVGTLPAGCSGDPLAPYGIRVTCDLPSLPAGASASVDIPLVITPKPGFDSMELRAVAGSVERDVRLANNRDTARLTLRPDAPKPLAIVPGLSAPKSMPAAPILKRAAR